MTDLLSLAVAAQLPVVAVSTRDVMNLPEVLKELTGKTPVLFSKEQSGVKKLFVFVWPPAPTPAPDLLAVYAKMVKSESTLVVVNPPKIIEPMFDAGEVPVPRSLLMKFLTHVVEDAKKAEELLRGLGGCTIKEAAELGRLTMARDASLTVAGLMATRKSSFQGSKGLTQVDTAQGFYAPPEDLVDWTLKEKPFFLNGTDVRLMPRGLLMDGPPGTGKTAASKWIAVQLGVPLYRVDVGGTKNKYVGESEANMLTNLQRLDQEEPCVALLDEVEKVFSTSVSDTSGTTSTMLSQLLWWLAERQSKVLVVMTTNNAKALPKELYREGRVDKVLYFGGLEFKESIGFVMGVLATFGVKDKATAEKIAEHAFDKVQSGSKLSQAVLTTAVYNFIKAKVG
jgi:hypothetical protein